MTCSIQLATPADLGMAQALLPQLATDQIDLQSVLVARLPGRAGICGAGVFSTQPVGVQRSGLRGDIFVLPSVRRQGIGNAILVRMRQELRRWNVDFLHTWDSVDSQRVPPFLLHAQFSPVRQVYCYEADAAVAVAWGEALLDALRAAGRIPAGATLAPLEQADRNAVVRMYADHFGGTDAAVNALLDRSARDPEARASSLALHLDRELIGFINWKRDDEGVPKVDMWIAAPRFRSGWPAVMLLVASMRSPPKARGRFDCNDDAVATLKIARRIGARLLSARASYVLAV